MRDMRNFINLGKYLISMGAERRLIFFSCYTKQVYIIPKINYLDLLGIIQYYLGPYISQEGETPNVILLAWFDQIWTKFLIGMFIDGSLYYSSFI